MPHIPDQRVFITRTFRDYLDDCCSVSAYCYNLECQHAARLDLEALADRHGLDTVLDHKRLRCTRCGSRKTQIRISFDMDKARIS
jgi:hypothetical protein